MKRWSPTPAVAPVFSGLTRTADLIAGAARPLPQSHAPEQSAVAIDAADLAARVVMVSLFSLMAVRIGADFLQTGRFTGLLLLASEMLVVVFTVLRRSAVAVDRSLHARILTTVSLLGPPLVEPAVVAPLLPGFITVSLSAFGLLIVIGGKISLGRSFGVMPANRGVVRSGLYRVVRHPIYLGYLLSHAAYVAANPIVWNIALLIAADIALLARAVCEEAILARDEEYRSYQQVVRWRVLPGVF